MVTNSRRRFLKEGVVTGATLGLIGIPESAAAQSGPTAAISTTRADAFMALFGLRYPSPSRRRPVVSKVRSPTLRCTRVKGWAR
jgi:hypothetical protein